MNEPKQQELKAVPNEKPVEAKAAPTDQDVALARLQTEKALTELGDDAFGSVAALAHYLKVAELFANSGFVPAHFRGKVGDCLIAVQMARRMGIDPLVVMQNLYLVKGKPGWSTAFMIAMANRAGVFRGPIRWRVEELGPGVKIGGEKGWHMPNLRVTAFAVDRNGELLEASVDSQMAVAEGWIENAKYRTMLQHMLQWRSATFLIRLYVPEVLMGINYAVEELETIPVEAKNVTPAPSTLDAFAEAGTPAIVEAKAAYAAGYAQGKARLGEEPPEPPVPAPEAHRGV